MRIREKRLKVMDMNGCGWIPCRVGIFPTTWSKYRERLEDLLIRHARLFPGFKNGLSSSTTSEPRSGKERF